MLNRVVARGLGKQYRLGAHAHNVLRERLAAMWREKLTGTPVATVEFWALRDVSFDIAEQEVVGLIGRNGAGKSTLLKLLSRITPPTEGEAIIRGKLASLLEVGVGFHPELSGRENVYLNGAILGMNRSEIRAKFDEIIQFAEVEKFLDTPVKRYSSGMYVRLAFAVAAHVDPDVLIVDEVLAVGDSTFQQKCLNKIREIRRDGKSVIVVSHNINTVRALCQRAIWLDEGRVRMVGEASEVATAYTSRSNAAEISWQPRVKEPFPFNYVDLVVTRGDTGESTSPIPASSAIAITLRFTVDSPLPPGRILLRVSDETGETLFASSSADGLVAPHHDFTIGQHRFVCTIPPHLLSPGSYLVHVTEPRGGYEIERDGVLSFDVSEEGSTLAKEGRPGKIAPLLHWELR